MASAQGSPSPAAALCAQQPSDVTLVKDILRPWVASRVNKADGGVNVHVANFYAVEPEDLAGRFAATVAINGDKTWYFLTEVRAQSRGTRKIRSVGDGWWQGEAGAKNILDPVMAGGRPIGSRKSFSFMRKTVTGAEIRLGWLMVEFYLHEYACDDGPGRRIDDVVLAKLYRRKTKRRRESLPIEAAAATAASAGTSKNPAGGADAATEPLLAEASAATDKKAAHGRAVAAMAASAGSSENPAGGAGAATEPLLAEAAAGTHKNLRDPPLLHNNKKAAHGRAAASRIKNPVAGVEKVSEANVAAAPAAPSQLHFRSAGTASVRCR